MLPALLIGTLGPLLGNVLDRVIPDPEARQKAIAEMYQQLQSADIAQLAVNKAEAESNSLFKGGWRPAVGWVCALALAWQYLVQPMGVWVATIAGAPVLATSLLNGPKLDTMLWELLIGMLGMGALRSFDKLKGLSGR
jgi:hypothetical protein